MDFGRFEYLLKTLYDLVKVSDYIAQMMETADVELYMHVYVDVVRLHNVAVDTIEAIEKIYTKEEN